MKGLSLHQPWATLIAIGAKGIETRSWATKYVGPVAIHASKRLAHVQMATFNRKPYREVLAAAGITSPMELPLSAIIATAHIGACIRFPLNERVWRLNAKPHEREFGDFADRRYGFILLDVRPLREPIPCRGALGLWDVPADILAQINAQGRVAA